MPINKTFSTELALFGESAVYILININIEMNYVKE